MTTFFTSDLHFGHKNIIKYCRRPFCADQDHPTKVDVETMNHALISNWNSVVKDDDTVWNLGDLAFCCAPGAALECLRQLKGHHVVIRGNHDEVLDTIIEQEHGVVPWIDAGRLIQELAVGAIESDRADGQTIVMCHYAMREWHHALRGVWHLFGHTHGLLAGFGKSVDVGVDNAYTVIGGVHCANSYRPISFAELKVYMDARPVGAHAEFGPGFVPSSKEASCLAVE